jgi:hypothetical protein
VAGADLGRIKNGRRGEYHTFVDETVHKVVIIVLEDWCLITVVELRHVCLLSIRNLTIVEVCTCARPTPFQFLLLEVAGALSVLLAIPFIGSAFMNGIHETALLRM